jgi:hypothetical protein
VKVVGGKEALWLLFTPALTNIYNPTNDAESVISVRGLKQLIELNE